MPDQRTRFPLIETLIVIAVALIVVSLIVALYFRK
jgi:hypothetical protein